MTVKLGLDTFDLEDRVTPVDVPTTVQITSSSSPSPIGQPVTFTAAVRDINGDPVTLNAFVDFTFTSMPFTQLIGTGLISSALPGPGGPGTVSITTDTLPLGASTVQASYRG